MDELSARPGLGIKPDFSSIFKRSLPLSILNFQFSILNFQFSILNSQFSINRLIYRKTIK
ncbi:MAG: hypothetical protein F6K31_39055 [Symploca sp. SIO2G7]|nr:hypothetical protein [Symploca sp. SIO2G7]